MEPALQAVQEAPATVEKVEAAQSEQLEEPAAEYWPGLQLGQDVDALRAEDLLPAGQIVQAAVPVDEA